MKVSTLTPCKPYPKPITERTSKSANIEFDMAIAVIQRSPICECCKQVPANYLHPLVTDPSQPPSRPHDIAHICFVCKTRAKRYPHEARAWADSYRDQLIDAEVVASYGVD